MKVISALRQWWWFALLIAALVMASTMLVLMIVPRSYTASAVVAVVPNTDTSPGGELVRLAVPTYAALATSDALAASMSASYGEERTRLAAAVSAEVAPSTNTVVVSVRWGEPDRAAELANGVVEELIAFSERDPILTAFVVAPAVPPAASSFPPTRATLVAGGVAAVALGVAAAWFRETRFRQRATSAGEKKHAAENSSSLVPH